MIAACEKHPRDPGRACARCGKPACAGCGAFSVDDEILCAACGEAVLHNTGLPLGTLLVAASYLGVVAVLAAAHQLRTALLGAAALLAIALARVFAVNRSLRRPTVLRVEVTDDGTSNVLVRAPAPTTSGPSGVASASTIPSTSESASAPPLSSTGRSDEA